MGTVNTNFDAQLLPRMERDWLQCKWAIHPDPCKRCSARKVVACCVSEARPGWWSLCLSCSAPLSNWVHGYERGGNVYGPRQLDSQPIVLLAVEPRTLPGSPSQGLELHIAQPFRPAPKVLTYVGTSFDALWRARVTWARRPPPPGPFALERDAQGRIIAPRDPTQAWPHDHSDSCVVVSTVLRKARPCFGCRRQIPTGATAFRPDAAPKAQWSAQGRRVRWCWACASAAPDFDGSAISEGTPHGPLRVHETDAT